jgi:hypothetical protein
MVQHTIAIDLDSETLSVLGGTGAYSLQRTRQRSHVSHWTGTLATTDNVFNFGTLRFTTQHLTGVSSTGVQMSFSMTVALTGTIRNR